MAIDPRKRQKKLAKRAKKQKAKAKRLRQKAAPRYGIGQISQAPIQDIIIDRNLFDKGLGHVVMSRNLGHGFMALSMFLVDMYCLGVKNAAFLRLTLPDYSDAMVRYEMIQSVDSVSPACARKLVEGAVNYARELGFPPHKDYLKAHRIFGDIRVEDCDVEFEYGYNGKPMFISGPYDSPAKCKQIINKLTKRLGPDGFTSSTGDPDLDIFP